MEKRKEDKLTCKSWISSYIDVIDVISSTTGVIGGDCVTITRQPFRSDLFIIRIKY